MATLTASPTVTPVQRSRRARAAHLVLSTVRILLLAQFVVGGLMKLAGNPAMVAMFDDIGAGQGLRLLVGACEVAGGVGLVLPRVAQWAAIGLVGLMVGAAATNVVALQTSPAVPLVLGMLTLLVATARTGKAGRR